MEQNKPSAGICETSHTLPDSITMPQNSGNYPEYGQPYIQDGWRCPVCGSVYAPWVRCCSNCSPAVKPQIVWSSSPSAEPVIKEPSTADPTFKHPSTVSSSPLND